MNYKPLKSRYLKLSPKEEIMFDSKEGAILIPSSDSKIYLHWLNSNGKMMATFTLMNATQVENTLKVINGGQTTATVHAIFI